MSETNYLCRVPSTGIVIILREEDYKYQRNHEERLNVPDPKNDLVVLAQGTKREMILYYKLAGELTNVS